MISGKDKGKEAIVRQVITKKEALLLEGVNVVKKHVKPNSRNKEGGIIELTKPISVGRAMLICPKCSQPTRIGYKIENGKKYRVCKKCAAIIEI